MKHLLFFALSLICLKGFSQDSPLFYLAPIDYDDLQKGAFISLSDDRLQFENAHDTTKDFFENRLPMSSQLS